MLMQLGFKLMEPTTLLCDNLGAISMTKNPTNHGRSKHIDIQYHFIREKVAQKLIDVQSVPGEDNVADTLTKPLAPTPFNKYRTLLSIRPIEGVC